MAVLTYEELKETVENIARKYSRNVSMSYEDFEQELWYWTCVKQPEDLAWARTQLVNRAIDLSRNDWNTNNGIRNVDYSTEVGQKFIAEEESDSSPKDMSYQRVESETAILQALDMLGKRERVYVVAKGYLACGIEIFEDEFNQILDTLTPEERELILTSPKADTDDLILKVILHIKTGSNSCSIRAMKTNLRIGGFRDLLINNV